jgi:Skp family chaperone for outer membrane proteins
MADYSTYARVVLSNSETISTLIRKYSLSPIEAKPSLVGLPQLGLLSLKQIEDALLDPQNSIQTSIAVYATIIQLHRHLIAVQQHAYSHQLAIEEAIKELRDKYTSAEKGQKELLADTMKKLEKHYKEISAMQKELKELESQLVEYEIKLTELTADQDTEWDAFREHILLQLCEELEKNGIPLTDLEKNEIRTQEIWTEITKRFKTLSLPIPKVINVTQPEFKTYFELKAYLAIHASLSRRMLPHSIEDIEKL